MATEIERKFLVKGDEWRSLGQGTVYRQGYIPTAGKQTVRIRTAGDKGYITLKGPSATLARPEFEYEIPLDDAEQLLRDFCEQPLIEKTRYKIPIGDVLWEVDEFEGANAGLIVAEVELTSEQQVVDIPDWIEREVSGDIRYFNVYLAKNPFQSWPQQS